MKLTKELINGIAKYINTMYSPKRIEVDNEESDGEYGYLIKVYFDHIDDSYMTNPHFHSPDKLKARNLENEIRKDIYGFFGVMTTGLSFEGHTPYLFYELRIKVKLD